MPNAMQKLLQRLQQLNEVGAALSRERDIDHLLLSPAAADRLIDAQVDRDFRGREKASDHAPTWVELRPA